MPNPFPINFTHNRFGANGGDGWRGDNKFDNTKYTLATNVYPKLNNSENNIKRTFGKARPIKHIRKGRYEKGGRKTYNNSRLIYELDRPGGATVKVDLSNNDDKCNGVSSTLFLMTKTSAACCPQANSLTRTRRFHAGDTSLREQLVSHNSYSNYFQGRNWSFDAKDKISGKAEVSENRYLKDTMIKKTGCGEVIYKLKNEKFGINSAATSGNFTQSLRNKPFLHPNQNEFNYHINCEVLLRCNINGRCLSKPIETCKRLVYLFTIRPFESREGEPEPEGNFERIDTDGVPKDPLFYEPEPAPEPEGQPEPEPAPEPEGFPILTGSLVKGYISNATLDFYRVSDPSYNRVSLATTITDELGAYEIPQGLPLNKFLLLVSSGGTDIATGLPVGERKFKKVFKIPSEAEDAILMNNTVTALTSIVSEKVERNIENTSEDEVDDDLVAINLNDETESLKSNLGIPVGSEIDTNYLDRNIIGGAAVAAVNTMVNSLINIVSGVQSISDTIANLSNVLTSKRDDIGGSETLIDISNLDSVVKSTLNEDVAADTDLANNLVTYSTQVRQVVDEVTTTEDGSNESILENLEKMVKFTSENNISDVSDNITNLDAQTLSAQVQIFQVFSTQPEPEPFDAVVGDCSVFQRELLKLDKLEGTALGQLSQYISFFRDGQFTSLAGTQANMERISQLIESSGYFTFSSEEITGYTKDDTLFAEYKIFAHSMIDGLNAAILINRQNQSLSTANSQLEQFKTILTNRELLEDFIEVNYNNFNAGLVEVDHTISQSLQLDEHYKVYINRYGIPPNGVFDSNLLSMIYQELNGASNDN